jgi:hypothetical protein
VAELKPTEVAPDEAQRLLRQFWTEAGLLVGLFLLQGLTHLIAVYAMLWILLLVLYARQVRALWLLDGEEFAERLDAVPRLVRLLRSQPISRPGPSGTHRFWTVVLPSSLVTPVLLSGVLWAWLWLGATCGVDRAMGESPPPPPTLLSLALLVWGGYYVYTVRRRWQILRQKRAGSRNGPGGAA